MVSLAKNISSHLKQTFADLHSHLSGLEGTARTEFERLQSGGGEIALLAKELKSSESALIDVLEGKHDLASTGAARPEFGMALAAIETAHPELSRLLGLPEARLSDRHLESAGEILKGGIVGSDGTIFGPNRYEELDIGWAYAPVNYIYNLLDKSAIAPFRTNAPVVNTNSSIATISVYGDWGTGYFADGNLNSPAQMVLEQLEAKNADYNVHLGDVYYSGTDTKRWPADEEKHNLIDLITQSKLQNNFTLNSNHEMYGAARGYYEALDSGAFGGQNGTSYFAIESPDWILLGLDSAYDATYENTKSLLYMEGAIRDSAQIDFMADCAKKNKPLIVCTHHVPVSLDGKTTTGLWDDVTKALGRAPEFWYFGHTHTGVAYSDKSVTAQKGTVARCLGHAAIPYGKAWGLFEDRGEGALKPEMDWVAHEPLSEAFPGKTTEAQANRVQNGYAVLELSATGLGETIYAQNGQRVYQRSFDF